MYVKSVSGYKNDKQRFLISKKQNDFSKKLEISIIKNVKKSKEYYQNNKGYRNKKI